ncbi:MAG: hypothetical protein AAFZ18_29010 [Myxococcota bacterium]
MWPALGIALLGLPPVAVTQLDRAAEAAEVDAVGVREALEPRLDAIVEAIPPAPTAVRARALLQLLHGSGPSGLLRTYDEFATTVVDVMEGGRFNCVSATALFLIAAHALELDAHGFDPAPEDRDRIARQVAAVNGGGRGIVDEEGEQVGFEGLLAATFVNRATVAQERGDLAEAERLFARGAALAPSPTSRRLLQDQRAALLARLALSHLEGSGPPALERAQMLLLRARELEPHDAQVLGIVRQNLRAVTERMIRSAVDAGQDSRVERTRALFDEVASRGERVGLHAFLLSERARRAAEAEDAVSALLYLDQALALPLGAEESPLRGVLDENRRGMIPSAAEQRASEGDLEGARETLGRLTTPPATREAWARIHRLAGHAHYRAGSHTDAIDIFRAGLEKVPGHPELEQDLNSSLQQFVLQDVRAGRCARAAPILEEIRAFDDRFAVEAGLDCQLVVAQKALSDGAFANAAEALEAGRRWAPSSSRWRAPLVGVLSDWAVDLARKEACADVWPVVRRLTSMSSPVPKEVGHRCPPR